MCFGAVVGLAKFRLVALLAPPSLVLQVSLTVGCAYLLLKLWMEKILTFFVVWFGVCGGA